MPPIPRAAPAEPQAPEAAFQIHADGHQGELAHEADLGYTGLDQGDLAWLFSETDPDQGDGYVGLDQGDLAQLLAELDPGDTDHQAVALPQQVEDIFQRHSEADPSSVPIEADIETEPLSDGSEYYELSPEAVRPSSPGDYVWDEHEESLSFIEAGATSQPQLPKDWPPRRLSSECSNQKIVSQLAPTASAYAPYFEHEVFGDTGPAAGSSIITPQQTNKTMQLTGTNSVAEVTAEEEDQLSNSDTNYHPSDVSDSPDSPGSPNPPSIELEVDSSTTGQPPRSRQSERIRGQDATDYLRLHSRGRTGDN